MTLLVDSGLVVAALVDSGPDGTWADQLLATDDLAAPHLMPVGVANILQRANDERRNIGRHGIDGPLRPAAPAGRTVLI